MINHYIREGVDGKYLLFNVECYRGELVNLDMIQYLHSLGVPIICIVSKGSGVGCKEYNKPSDLDNVTGCNIDDVNIGYCAVISYIDTALRRNIVLLDEAKDICYEVENFPYRTTRRDDIADAYYYEDYIHIENFDLYAVPPRIYVSFQDMHYYAEDRGETFTAVGDLKVSGNKIICPTAYKFKKGY